MRWLIRCMEAIGSYALMFRETRRMRDLRAALDGIQTNPYRKAREKIFVSNREFTERRQALRKLRLKMELENACGRIAKEFEMQEGVNGPRT